MKSQDLATGISHPRLPEMVGPFFTSLLHILFTAFSIPLHCPVFPFPSMKRSSPVGSGFVFHLKIALPMPGMGTCFMHHRFWKASAFPFFQILPISFYCFSLSISQGAQADRCRVVGGGPDQGAIQPLKQPALSFGAPDRPIWTEKSGLPILFSR